VKFEWTPKFDENFHLLKDILTSVPLSNIAYHDEEFLECTNACKEGIGGFLSQKYHAVCYKSHKLKEHERNNATHNLELASITRALKMWRHHFMWKRFELRTYHCGLNHLLVQPTLNSMQTRWMQFLSEYDFEIKHIKGK
jgi:hypothetical protein